MNKIIVHLKRNKWKYIVGVLLIIIGFLIFYILRIRPSTTIINNLISTTNSPNAVITFLERRGHPGFVVKCLETGEVFASQNRCASLLGINPADLSKHLRGLKVHAGGLHFERLGEAVSVLA